MDQETRNKLQRATQQIRILLEDEFAEQLEGTFDILQSGNVLPNAGKHLDAKQRLTRQKLVDAIEHIKAGGMKPVDAVKQYTREAAFTFLNRFVALRMLEARGLLQECVSKGSDSGGFKEFSGLAPGMSGLDDGGYRLYLECLFDELTVEVKLLFDRRDSASLLWPRRGPLTDLLDILGRADLTDVWIADETIGWVYQYFNSGEERKKMREESQAPRNSRELAVRNQFFTPRYVVEFLSDNTLGRMWYEMRKGETRLANQCAYLIRNPSEIFLNEGQEPPVDEDQSKQGIGQDELIAKTVYVQHRAKKDPRDIKILDPACGSGHFLLYAFDLLITIYEEAWHDDASPKSTISGQRLREDYTDLGNLYAALPGLVLACNLHGIDIDPRAAQIAALALWMRGQRAFNEFQIPREQRPAISRSNIVCAEPMPGEATFLDEFIADHLSNDAESRLMASLVRKVFEAMKLAGEAGSLLRIEEDITAEVAKAKAQWLKRPDYKQGTLFETRPRTVQHELDLTRGITDESFWEEAEQRIYDALSAYSDRAAQSGGYQKRLFAADAGRGFAFIDVCRRRYDIVVMNPPFGLVQDDVFEFLQSQYPDTYVDVYASFVARVVELAPNGLVGAITSRSFISSKKLVRWREKQILPWVQSLIDLGKGVMDDANIESCAYIIAPQARNKTFIAINSSKEKLHYNVNLEAAIRNGLADVYVVSRDVIRRMPFSKLLYFVSGRLATLLSSKDTFEPKIGTARKGLTTFDDFRFLRLRWEVPSNSVGRGKTWELFAKGGEYSNYYIDVHLVVKRGGGARELAERNVLVNGQTAQSRQGESYYYRQASQYTGRSQAGFSARFVPGDCVMSSNAPLVISESDVSTLYILGWLNSRLTRVMIEMQAMDNDFVPGIVKTLPWIQPDSQIASEVTEMVDELVSIHQRIASLNETDALFTTPWGDHRSCAFASIQLLTDHLGESVTDSIRRVQLLQANVTKCVDRLYGVDSELLGEDVLERDVVAGVTIAPIPPKEAATRLLSFFLGKAFETSKPIDDESDRHNAWRRPSELYPRYRDDEGPAVLVDDEGYNSDVVHAITSAGSRYADNADELLRDLPGTLGSASIRTYLARSFFTEHIKRYSKSRRKAPIYWQLATPSATYSVWLYYHRFTRDTFFKVLNEFAKPKLDHERKKLERIRSGSGGEPTRSQQKEIEEQEKFVSELAAMTQEIERIAPLWNPNLDDGVIINFAPLWRLAPQNKSWQKECKNAWDKLVKGEYDWAHLAMHLWPERVVPKCSTDASLAIAHGLEEVFWEQDDRDRYQPKEEPESGWEAVIEKLVEERTSPAVKASLQSLLDAPAPAGASSTKRRRKKAGA